MVVYQRNNQPGRENRWFPQGKPSAPQALDGSLRRPPPDPPDPPDLSQFPPFSVSPPVRPLSYSPLSTAAPPQIVLLREPVKGLSDQTLSTIGSVVTTAADALTPTRMEIGSPSTAVRLVPNPGPIVSTLLPNLVLPSLRNQFALKLLWKLCRMNSVSLIRRVLQ